MGRLIDWQLEVLFGFKRLTGSRSNFDSALVARAPQVTRASGSATVHFSVGSLGTSLLDDELRSLARNYGLAYTSERGQGLLFRPLVVTVRGDDAAVSAFADYAGAKRVSPASGI